MDAQVGALEFLPEMCLQRVDQVRRAGLRLDDRKLAELDSGAGHGPAPELAGAHLQPEALEAVREAFGIGDVEDHEFLLRGQPQPG